MAKDSLLKHSDSLPALSTAGEEHSTVAPDDPPKLIRRTFLKQAVMAGAAVGGAAAAGVFIPDTAFAEKARTINQRAQKTLTVWHIFAPSAAKAAYDALAKLAAQFEKQTKIHIVLDFVQFTEAGAFQEKVTAAAASSNPPDIVMLSGPVNYAYTGAARILDKYIASSSVVKPKYWIPGQWARGVWQGHVYGVPMGADANALFFWNRGLFKKHGLNPDQPPTTWAELTDLTERLFKRDTHGHVQSLGFLPTWDQAWPLVWYYLQGPTSLLSNSQPPKVLFNDIYGVRGLQYQSQLTDINGGATLMNAFSSGFQTAAQDPFITQKVAMDCTGTWQRGVIQQYNPSLSYGVTTMPLPPGGTTCTTSGGFAWSIPQRANNPDDAWRFIEFASMPEQMLALMKAASTQPARLDLLTDKYFTSDPVGKAAAGALRNARGWGEGPWGAELWTQYSVNALANVIYHKMTAKQALDKAAQTLQPTINQDS